MLDRIRAVSLDLDDTLWETMPVLHRAERRLLEWLDRHYPRMGSAYGPDRLRELRMIVGRQHPDRVHDLTWLRTEALRRAAVDTGYPETLAAAAFEVFYAARNDLEPYDDVRAALARLAALVPVYALSNGNACVHRVGLGEYFTGAIAPHHAGAAKPDRRIYAHLLEMAGVAAHEVLHVGDDPHTDVHGARAAGLLTAWMNRARGEWTADMPRADFEVHSLAELAELVGAHVPPAAVAGGHP